MATNWAVVDFPEPGIPSTRMSLVSSIVGPCSIKVRPRLIGHHWRQAQWRRAALLDTEWPRATRCAAVALRYGHVALLTELFRDHLLKLLDPVGDLPIIDEYRIADSPFVQRLGH